MSATVKVTAPSTLNEGYTFDAVVDGKTIAVTVPPGGVKEGDVFDAIVAVQVVAEEGALATPLLAGEGRDEREGVWRKGLFSCCDVFCKGTFWMSFCCNYAAIGQLLQRMKLGALGEPGKHKNTCMIWTIILVIMIALESSVSVITQTTPTSETTVWTYVKVSTPWSITVEIIGFIVTILSLVALTRTRYFMRQKWSIPADCCENSGCLSDCCCVYWCGCCSIIQMLRHTHDEEKDRYDCCSATGLSADAEEVV